VLDALQELEAAGEVITFPGVARAAGVSTWLAYSPGIREHIESARKRHVAATMRNDTVAPAGLRAEIASARDEIKTLRAERDRLQQRLRLHLGAEIDGPQRSELIARLADLETINRRLVAERDARSSEERVHDRRVRELEDELTAARESLRRMIRAKNTGRGT
jgi:chromosome segregation ATPase